MKVIHVLRKPLREGSVAANVLTHGTGAIYVDASRVSTSDVVQTHSRSPEASKAENRPVYGEYGPWGTHQTEGQKLGRWPANVILQHLPACSSEGCDPACSVPALDRQTGTTKSTGGRAYQNTNDMYSGGWGHKGSGVAMDPGYGDEGGVSRYFKRIGGNDDDPSG